ncbi:hypothetical protein [Oleomonas cavernae]|uniref:hypothetical protein n=1 Tax=Oleomonas cavernae TaxID=2320859 RepID=UPI001314E17E|nr:hypothetical protein [Oleomonas cavernae]
MPPPGMPGTPPFVPGIPVPGIPVPGIAPAEPPGDVPGVAGAGAGESPPEAGG